jgi:predicted SAM-dependent methyltransferase
MPRFLHLAASRFERLSRSATALLCQPGWTHLGEPPIDWPAEVREHMRYSLLGGLRLWLAYHYRRWRPRYTQEELVRLYSVCEFREFYFQAGARLNFADDSFDFIVSEHFFEHLHLPDALALMRECQRILRPGGVIRTSVPDADLRGYAPPEPPGYPGPGIPWTHHQKHKSRWNVYSFSEVLRISGLDPQPIQYCSSDRQYHDELSAAAERARMNQHAAADLLATTAYFRRLPSLIVDGVKS